MSVKEDTENLQRLVGTTVQGVEVVESGYGDGFTVGVTLTLSNGETVSFSGRSFNDGSSALDVDYN